MKIKRILIVIFACALLLNSYMEPVKAELPNTFWGLQTEFEKAVEESNNQNKIYYGEQILELFRPIDLNDMQSVVICAVKSEIVGTTYEALGDYENAIKYYKEYVPLAKILGWSDGEHNARSKIKHLTFKPELYIKSSDIENNVYFNAKNEPISGTYAGIVPYIQQNELYRNIAEKEGSYLVYYTHGADDREVYKYHTSTMIKAEKEKKAVEYAFNVSGDDNFWDILNEREYLEKTIDFLASYDVPVFFRFGAEMNGGENCNDPQSFITAFRFVTDIVRARSSNIAMVFGPQGVGSRDRPYQNYYPGDEYVDWVGISQYSSKYFLGNSLGIRNINDSFFMTGEYSNPLTVIKQLVDEYGGRKPLMLSECGVSNYTKSPYIDEDLVTNQWAQVQLKRMYSYAPMIFPQLKAMHYFNVDMTAYEYERYSLYNSPVMANLYNSLISNSNFLGSTIEKPAFRYKKVTAHEATSSTLELSTYAVYPKTMDLQVSYWIDGNLVKQTETIPYDANIDTKSLSNGTHFLEVSIVKNGSVLRIMPYEIIKSDSQIILKKENVFVDVTNSSFEWAKIQIENLAAIDIINGIDYDGSSFFKPGNNITRAEYAKLVVRAFDLDTVDQNCNFKDVDSNDWYYPFVAAAYNSGIVKGRIEGQDSVFAPNEPITRQDMCMIITNALVNIKGVQMINDNEINDALIAFGDQNDISDYAKKNVAFAYIKGIIKGSDNEYGVRCFRPLNNANRAEAAIVIHNGLDAG